MTSATKFLALILCGLAIAGCDNKSDDKKQEPPPADPTNLFPATIDGDATAVWKAYGPMTTQAVVADCTAKGFAGACYEVAGTYGAQYGSALQLVDAANNANLRHLTISAAKTYEIKFKAVASQASVKVHMVLQQDGGSYATYKTQDFDIATTLTDYTTGTFPGADATDAMFALQFGGLGDDGATIDFSDIQLLEQ